MPRTKTYTEEDKRWVWSQNGTNREICELAQKAGKLLSKGIIKRIRQQKTPAEPKSAHTGPTRDSAQAGLESAEIGDEIIVRGPSIDLDPYALSGGMALQQTQDSIPVLDRQSTACPENTTGKEDGRSAMPLSSLGKRKRLANSSDETPRRSSTQNPVTGPQIIDFDSNPDDIVEMAERMQHNDVRSLRGRDCLNSTGVNGLVELFGGFDAQTYLSDEFRSHRQIEISRDAQVNGIPLNINDKTWVAVIMDGTTGSFKYYNSLSPQWTEEIVEAMKGLSSRVINVDLKSPEEVSCAKQLNGHDDDIHTVLNLTYEMLGIPISKYIDSPWWRGVLSWIWDRQSIASSRLSIESAGDDAVDCADSSLLSQDVLQSSPKVKSFFQEQLIEARKAVRQGLNNWSASCKRSKEDAAQLTRLQKAQEERQAKVRGISEELETIEKLIQIVEELGHNKHLVNVDDSKEKAKCLREDLMSTKNSAQESEEQLVQLIRDISTRREELTSLRGDVGGYIVKLDIVFGAILELSQTVSVENPQLATFNRFSGPSSNDQLRLDAAQETQNTQLGNLSPGQQRQLSDVITALKQAKSIIALVGAGISTSAGIPDFRSKNGLFRTLKKKHKLNGSGTDLFHASVYQTPEKTAAFHEMVRNLSAKAHGAEPTKFHRMLGDFAEERRLLRLISQNIDGLDTAIPSLATKVPLTPPYPTTLQLHGSIEWMRCISCHRIDKLDPKLFDGPSLSPCVACSDLETDRTRSAKAGGMRPRFTLYNEWGEDDDTLHEVLESDLKEQYDMCIVAGTALKGIPSVRKLVCDMSSCAGVMVWINEDPPPKLKNVTWHLTFQGLCDDVATRYMAS